VSVSSHVFNGLTSRDMYVESKAYQLSPFTKMCDMLVSYAKDELMRAKACNILLEFITLLVGSL
jgi:hypothetical protein